MKPLYCTQGHANPSGNRFCSQCGEQLTLPANQGIELGLKLGDRYRIVRELGYGSFGRTYLAEDLNRFNEPCVLKEFAPQVQSAQFIQKAAELFEREAGILYKLQHPQIPKFRELFRVQQEERERLFLVQDFVEGQTYRALLETRQFQGLRFTEAEVTQLLRQILPVLAYIHSLGVIHRDISPDNLMSRSTDGLPVLIDFGAVKQVAVTVASQFAASPTAIATRLGKIGYAPQEQMQGGVVYPNSDLYALGATVLTLLTGKEPQQFIDPHTQTWNWRQQVNLSPTLGSILDKMLQPIPSDRYHNASQVLQALAPQPVHLTSSPPPPPLPEPQTKATLAVAPAQIIPNPESASTPTAETTSASATTYSSLYWLKTILLGLVLIIGAGGFGWWAGNLWIKSKIQQPPHQEDFPTPVILPNEDSEPPPSTKFSAEEQQRKQLLRQRRTNLGIDYDFYIELVNEEFGQKYPEQQGKQLGTSPEDAKLRKEWDEIAANFLTRIEQIELSVAARQQLGSYSATDRDRWKTRANSLRISSRALYDLADVRFFRQFPEQRDKDFLNQPIGQVWQGTVADTLKALKDGNGLERIIFEPEATGQQISGILKPGQGKVFIAELTQGQTMEVKLSANEKVLFSIYSPSGQTKLLEDSRDRSWSGELPESGFYEFVVVSEGSQPSDYQLDLTVENGASIENY